MIKVVCKRIKFFCWAQIRLEIVYSIFTDIFPGIVFRTQRFSHRKTCVPPDTESASAPTRRDGGVLLSMFALLWRSSCFEESNTCLWNVNPFIYGLFFIIYSVEINPSNCFEACFAVLRLCTLYIYE